MCASGGSSPSTSLETADAVLHTGDQLVVGETGLTRSEPPVGKGREEAALGPGRTPLTDRTDVLLAITSICEAMVTGSRPEGSRRARLRSCPSRRRAES